MADIDIADVHAVAKVAKAKGGRGFLVRLMEEADLLQAHFRIVARAENWKEWADEAFGKPRQWERFFRAAFAIAVSLRIAPPKMSRSSAPQYRKELEARLGKAPSDLDEIISLTGPAGAAGSGLCLVVEAGAGGERVVPLPRAGRLGIGRDPGADIQVDDRRASGLHCTLVVEGERITLLDEGSKNGTFVNEGEIEKTAVIEVHDRIRIGRTVLRLARVGATETDTEHGGGDAQ